MPLTYLILLPKVISAQRENRSRASVTNLRLMPNSDGNSSQASSSRKLFNSPNEFQ